MTISTSSVRGSRGPGPRDRKEFAARHLTKLSHATFDLSLLYARGYRDVVALDCVTGRYQLQQRQRLAVRRAAARPSAIHHRQRNHDDALRQQRVVIDGFNLMILLEAALGGAPLFRGVDGCLRDLSSVHGNYRPVKQTEPALQRFGSWLEAQELHTVVWCFDRPVSNSGKIAAIVEEQASHHNWPWRAETREHVDQYLIESDAIVISTDKIVVEQSQRWNKLGTRFIEECCPDAWVITLPHKEERAALENLAASFPGPYTKK